MTTDASAVSESVDDFRVRARDWLAQNMEKRALHPDGVAHGYESDHPLQQRLFEGGFAGIAFPREYGGAGLTLEHQRAFADEAAGYVMPASYTVSIGMLGATLLDHGSEFLKKTHLPAILRGDETWVQLLSEPGSGSDMAAARTRADLDGDQWALNGSKIWTTHGNLATHGMCLARTNWDVPKHAGLSMFAVPLASDGVTITPIVNNTGLESHFCQEFFDNVALPAENLIGDAGNGWAIAQTLLRHERNATAGLGHGIGLGGPSGEAAAGVEPMIEDARRSGAGNNPAVRQAVAATFVAVTVASQLSERLKSGMSTGKLVGQWGSLPKLGMGVDEPEQALAGLAVAGSDGVIWDDEDPQGGRPGYDWLGSRRISIAGGTNEMQRNIISERLLDLPREGSADRGIPFREVPMGPS
jgi:alkylation response protein AidB-like acyl-CoA dehydrogenase